MPINKVDYVEKEAERAASREFIELDEIGVAPTKLDDLIEVQDPFVEVNIGGPKEYRLTFVSKLLESSFKEQLIQLLKEYQG